MREIPADYVPLSGLGCHGKGRKATISYRAVRRGIETGEIASVKFMRSAGDLRGQLFVDPHQAADAIAAAMSMEDAARGLPAAGNPAAADPGSEAMAATLDRIAEVVCDIAASLARLADASAIRRGCGASACRPAAGAEIVRSLLPVDTGEG